MGLLTNLLAFASVFFVCHGAGIFVFVNYDYIFYSSDDVAYFLKQNAKGVINVDYFERGEFPKLTDVRTIKIAKKRWLIGMPSQCFSHVFDEQRTPLYKELMALAKKVEKDLGITINFMGIDEQVKLEQIPIDVGAYLEKTTKSPIKADSTKFNGIGKYKDVICKVKAAVLGPLEKSADANSILEKLEKQNTELKSKDNQSDDDIEKAINEVFKLAEK